MSAVQGIRGREPRPQAQPFLHRQMVDEEGLNERTEGELRHGSVSLVAAANAWKRRLACSSSSGVVVR